MGAVRSHGAPVRFAAFGPAIICCDNFKNLRGIMLSRNLGSVQDGVGHVIHFDFGVGIVLI